MNPTYDFHQPLANTEIDKPILTGQSGAVIDRGERRWRDWLFALVGVLGTLVLTVSLAENPWRLIVLDDHPWIALLPAASGFSALVWFAFSRRSRYEHTTLVVIVGSCCLLVTGCIGVVAVAGSDGSGSEMSSITDESNHSVVRRVVLDTGTSSLCVEFEFRTGDGLFDRHSYDQFCVPELVSAAPSLSGDSFVLARSDGTNCKYRVDWHTLNVSFGTPFICAQSTR